MQGNRHHILIWKVHIFALLEQNTVLVLYIGDAQIYEDWNVCNNAWRDSSYLLLNRSPSTWKECSLWETLTTITKRENKRQSTSNANSMRMHIHQDCYHVISNSLIIPSFSSPAFYFEERSDMDMNLRIFS